MTQQFATVDEYIGTFPAGVGKVLEEIRRTILAAAPGAEEKISYGMPLITVGGRRLILFAGWKAHTALYGVPRMDGGLEDDLAPHRGPKGTLTFPLADPFPHELLGRLVAELVRDRTAAPDAG